jgi:hypothetical protein
MGKVILWCILGLVVILGLTWIGQGNQFFMLKVFGVATANVNRQIFEQSNSYNKGKIQNLIKYMDEYRTADADGQKAILQFVKMDYADYNEDNPQSNLSPQMISFLKKAKYGD